LQDFFCFAQQIAFLLTFAQAFDFGVHGKPRWTV
jgi:hypothetical protein